jgi:hypothetical protein
MPEVALEAVGFVRVLGEHPAKEHVFPTVAGALQETLPQIHVVAAHPLRDLASWTDALNEEDARTAGGHGTSDVGFG